MQKSLKEFVVKQMGGEEGQPLSSGAQREGWSVRGANLSDHVRGWTGGEKGEKCSRVWLSRISADPRYRASSDTSGTHVPFS